MPWTREPWQTHRDRKWCSTELREQTRGLQQVWLLCICTFPQHKRCTRFLIPCSQSSLPRAGFGFPPAPDTLVTALLATGQDGEALSQVVGP